MPSASRSCTRFIDHTGCKAALARLVRMGGLAAPNDCADMVGRGHDLNAVRSDFEIPEETITLSTQGTLNHHLIMRD